MNIDPSQLQALLHQIHTRDAAASTTSDYVNAAVSASASVGPEGGNMEGWITYFDGRKIYLQRLSTTSYNGLAAVGGGYPVLGSLPYEELAGKEGRFEIRGYGTHGELQVFIGDRRVFANPLPVNGAGIGPWRIEGTLRFVGS